MGEQELTAAPTRPKRGRKQEAGEQTPRSAFGAILERTTQPKPPKSFFKECIGDLAAHFGSPCVAATARFGPEVVTEIKEAPGLSSEKWRNVYGPLLLEAETERRSRARVYDGKGGEGRVAVLATPILTNSGDTVGAIVVIAPCRREEDADPALHELRACAGLIGSALRIVGKASIPSKAQSRELENALVKAADYGSLRRLAFALTNNLRGKIGCDQVALSQFKRGHVAILAISGQDSLKHRTPGTLRMRQAMEECADRREPILYQNNPKWEKEASTTGHRLHRQWHEAAGNACVLSIPLMLHDRCVGVMSLRRPNDQPFSDEEVGKIGELIRPFAPVLPIMERADRSIATHAIDDVNAGTRWLLAPRGWGRKIVAVALLALAAWFFFGTGTYTATVPCQIAPAEVFHIAAPFEGAISAAPVRAGDRVNRGDVLVAFDTRELELRREELRSEIAAAQVEIDSALDEGDVSKAALANARRASLASQLALVEDSIDRARVVAQTDGRIIEGDLRARIGQTVPQGEPLFKLAPNSGWRVELEAPERLAEDLRSGLEAQFATTAMPDLRNECTVTSVRPATEVRDGRNVIIAEADLDAVPDWARSGMDGVAEVTLGQRPVWWLATHRVVEFVRLRFWL